jgi:PAS domain S-box-containing protein
MTTRIQHDHQARGPGDEQVPALLQGYATLLTARLAALGTRAEPATAPLVAELATAVEQLQVAETALRVQSDAGASATTALATAQRELRAVCDLLPDAYLVTDAAGVIREANHATSILVGYARTYVLGKPLTALLDPGATTAFLARCDALRQAPTDRPQTWEVRLRPRRFGTPLQVSVRVAPIRDATGSLTGFRWLLRDVTEQQATAAALERLQMEQKQQLRTQTMELEAVVRMQAEARALDQAALARLVRDPALRADLGAAGQAVVAADFDVRDAAARLKELFAT